MVTSLILLNLAGLEDLRVLEKTRVGSGVDRRDTGDAPEGASGFTTWRKDSVPSSSAVFRYLSKLTTA